MYRNTYIEIDLKKIKKNVENIINHYNGYTYYIGVVKANAYGFGYPIINSIIASGINYLAVSNYEEALNVRKLCDTPILCLEPIPIEYIDDCIKNNITITLSNYNDYLDLIKKNIKNLKIHIKIDSGMNRLGFTDKYIIKEICDNLKNNIEGIYTHLATSGINDKKFDNQINKFLELTSLINLNKIKMVHVGRSTTIINHKKLDFVNSTRIGILMYGVKPNKLVYKGIRKIKRNSKLKKYNISSSILECPIEIENPFTLISEIIEIKEVNKNNYIGYGLSYKTDKKIKIGIIPIGYADGIDLDFVGLNVKINDKKYEVIGSINSGMMTIKIDENVKIHDKVIVIDNIKEVAAHTKQTAYTVTSNIDSSLNRIYKED